MGQDWPPPHTPHNRINCIMYIMENIYEILNNVLNRIGYKDFFRVKPANDWQSHFEHHGVVGGLDAGR